MPAILKEARQERIEVSIFDFTGSDTRHVAALKGETSCFCGIVLLRN